MLNCREEKRDRRDEISTFKSAVIEIPKGLLSPKLHTLHTRKLLASQQHDTMRDSDGHWRILLGMLGVYRWTPYVDTVDIVSMLVSLFLHCMPHEAMLLAGAPLSTT